MCRKPNRQNVLVASLADFARNSDIHYHVNIAEEPTPFTCEIHLFVVDLREFAKRPCRTLRIV
jgi:uncharacterized protein YpmS